MFYAKRCKDTTFFNRLATKKMKIKNRSVLVRSCKNGGNAHYSYPARAKISHIGATTRVILLPILLISNKVVKFAHN